MKRKLNSSGNVLIKITNLPWSHRRRRQNLKDLNIEWHGVNTIHRAADSYSGVPKDTIGIVNTSLCKDL